MIIKNDVHKIERTLAAAMLTNYFTLRAIANELGGILSESEITEVFSQKKNELIISFQPPKPSELLLLISIDPSFHYLYLLDRNVRAKKNSVDLFASAIGTKISTIAIDPNDRIITLSLSNRTQLVLHLFGTTASNIYLLDDTRIIIESFKRDENLHETILPENSRRDAQSAIRNEEEFIQALLRNAEQSAITALKHVIPSLGPIYAAEVCSRAGIEQQSPLLTLSTHSLHRFSTEVLSLLDSFNNPRPACYETGAGECIISVVPLTHYAEYPHRAFPSMIECVAAVVNTTRNHRELEDERASLLTALRREQEHLHRSRTAADVELDQSQRAEEYERYGNLILGNLHNLRKGEKSADLPDLYNNGGMVRIKLDPKLSPAINAERYFKLAKSTRVKQSEAAKRARMLQQREVLITMIIEQIQNSPSLDELREIIRHHRKDLKTVNLMSVEKAEAPPPFRVFIVSGELEVWVGKNSANNDLLTMKYTKPHDLWFHARGASGSHTVLKVHRNKPVPREAIRQAAEIAAYYSKMRNASTVPVAYCERKYVRKPRGSATGAVVLEREELIFVQPHLP